jgi:peptidoglycan/xylan/chitin deacetylase (PgdA/CDA1 family)
MAGVKPIASLSLDLDNEWSYLKTHGDPAWRELPSYLDLVVPKALDLFARRGLRITFFVVGQDAALGRHRETLAAIAAAGHELGNHSFHHEPWLHEASEADAEREIARAEDAIFEATGQRPIGFRGPGYSLSAAILRVLVRRGYGYDASTFPTSIGPLARRYYLMTTRLSREERARRGALFGSWREAARPLAPYRWQLADASLLEIPVTTLPFLRVPIHVSYVLWLAGFSPALARRYFATAIALCRATGVAPSILLHPLDLLGGDEVRSLGFFPAMRLPGAAKRAWTEQTLDLLAKQFRIVPLAEHAAALRDDSSLRRIEPRLPGPPAGG